VRGAQTGNRLNDVLRSFDPFDDRMLEGTRARLLKDKEKVDEMTRETDRLTKALASQVTVRRDMNQQLQRLCEHYLKNIYIDFDKLVNSKKLRVEERLDALDERITALDAHFTSEKVRIKFEIEERHNELMEMLAKFRQLFAKECSVRSEREATIKKEMKEHDKDVEDRFKEEAEARESVSKKKICVSHGYVL
jgi:septum formation inhibitor MinC